LSIEAEISFGWNPLPDPDNTGVGMVRRKSYFKEVPNTKARVSHHIAVKPDLFMFKQEEILQ
jgi:hypothetical protein